MVKKIGMAEVAINFSVDTSPKEAKKMQYLAARLVVIHIYMKDTPVELQIMFIEWNTTTEDKGEAGPCAYIGILKEVKKSVSMLG